MASIGVEFAQSLVTALALASWTLMAGLVLVRVVRALGGLAGDGRAAGVLLQPVLVTAVGTGFAVRPSAGARMPVRGRAPPITYQATWRQCLRPRLWPAV